MLLVLEKGQAFADGLAGMKAPEAAGDGLGHGARRQLTDGRDQRPTLFIMLANHPRPDRFGQVVELVFELDLDVGPFLLDHQNLLQALGKSPGTLAVERPAQAHLINTEADLRRHPFVDAEIAERLTHVEIGLAGGDDT